MKNMQTAKLLISSLNTKSVELIPRKEFYLNNNEALIYTIYLPSFIELKSDLACFLNTKELERAKRFHKELDKNRFIVSRSILKFVLAAHTKLDAKNIDLDYHSNKKPYLASNPWLNFNISHSENFVVIAISRKRIGIDIEYISEDLNFTNLLAAIFEDNEILAIQNAVDKKHTFYTSWTRKEAFVKALGKGIDEDFKYIPCLDGEHRIDSSLIKTTENWQVYSFDLENLYLGAVAFESLSPISPNIVFHSVPNTMKELLEMTLRNN